MLPQLTAHRGKLLSRKPAVGTAVHAASFIREREIVLETALFRRPAKLRLIAAHEVFHFVWARLGNPTRQSYAALLKSELDRHARGETGESAAVRKLRHATQWRDYVCESFCDTAALIHIGRTPDCTLAARWLKRRKIWFNEVFAAEIRC